MCIGIPMKIVESRETWALCDNAGERVRIDMRLVGRQPSGTWVLVFVDAAREVLGETRARQIRNALSALEAAQSGVQIDHLFADLLEREPQLPDFLRPKTKDH